MTFTLRPNLIQVALLASLGSWLPLSFAASSDLSDTPLPVTSSVQPNLMFMIDTSGSMYSIVPDTPYDAGTTYVTCPAGNQLSGNFALVTGANAISTVWSLTVRNSDGTVYIDEGDTNTPGNINTFGTTGGNKCFKEDEYYKAALNAYNAANETTGASRGNIAKARAWPPAIYSGNYLNWYFGATATPTSAANFGANATMKPGTTTRLAVAKTSTASVVTGLDKVRIGLFTYDNPAGDYSTSGGKLLLPMTDLSANRTTVDTAITNIAISGTGPGTPLAETHAGMARYFAKTGTGTSSYTTNLTIHPGTGSSSSRATTTLFPRVATSADTAAAPITDYCQKSFAIVVTDGLATVDRDVESTYIQDYAGYCAANAWNCTIGNGRRTWQESPATCTSGSTGTCVAELYESNAQEPSDYLDDVAAAMYDIDFRPDLVPATGTKTVKNNVYTYAIGFADPTLAYSTLISRAATKGGGLSFTVNNAADLVTAFSQITDDILAKDGSAAAVAVANAHVTNTDNASYATSYNSGVWSGDLIAYPISTSTGRPNVFAPIWDSGCADPTAYVDPTDTTKGILGCSAQTLLDAQTSSTRHIFTSNDTSTCFTNCGIPFQPTTASGTLGVNKLSTAQQTLLNTPSTTDGAAVVNYLRGDRTGETAGTYRSRAHLLGDTVNAEPLVVREPSMNYIDAGYATFKASNDTRARIVVQAANDGMVHAFNSLTGVEEWAYIPNILISNSKDPLNSSTSLLNTRSRKTSFKHYFLLDGTPVSGDVDFGNTYVVPGTITPDWRTIVVGGMGKGGRGYYALDVTATVPTGGTDSAKETNAAAKALWEFPRSITTASDRNSAFLNMGYTFGKPIITKITGVGWVVLVASGYNNGTNTGDSNGDGLGHLYVINAKTGDLIKDISTPATAGDRCHATPTTNPCGLAFLSAYVENADSDNTVQYVYGGDLYGNVYRWDLTDSTVANWTPANKVRKLATLRSGTTVAAALQPVTTAPELTKVTISGTDRYFVYVGTGMYLGTTDLPCPPTGTCSWTPNAQSTQTQTMYGIVDPRTTPASGTAIIADPAANTMIAQTYTTSGTTRTISTNTVNYSTKNGWYINFTGGERIVTDPALAAGVLVFTSNTPSTTPCIPGGSSYIYAVNYTTGGQVAGATWGGTSLGSALASRPVLIQLPDGTIKAIVRLSDTTTVTTSIPTTTTPVAGRRVSWRELLDN
jgi:type IV pilus assembly protein PilY1